MITHKIATPLKHPLRLTNTLLAIPFLLAPSFGHSQPTDNTTQETVEKATAQAFDAITIMGEEQSKQTPWATQTKRDVLDNLQILNWSELGGRAEPGVNFSTNTNSVNIRGLDQTRVLTRIDGIRLPYLVDIRGAMGGISGGLSTIDFNALSSIDIVRGADSSTVGSGAMGGVVDVLSLSPSDLLLGDKKIGALTKTGYYSVDNSWLINAAVAGQAPNGLLWLIQAGTQLGHETQNMGSTGGYGISRNEPNPNNYTQQNYQLKLEQSFEGGHTIGLAGAYFTRQDDIQDMTAEPRIYAPNQSKVTDKKTRQSLAMNYAWSASHSKSVLDTFTSQIYWQSVELSSHLNTHRLTMPIGDYQRNNRIQENSWGVNLEGTKYIAGEVSQRWAMGGDWHATSLKQYAGGKDSCPPPPYTGQYRGCAFFHNNQSDIPDTTGNQYALWLENTIGFAQDRFSLTPALRHDYYQYSPSNGGSGDNKTATDWQASSGQAWSPKLLASWSATEALRFYAQYALSFNAPTATQLYSRFGTPGQYLITGNPTLAPEKGRGWEFGAKYDDSQRSGSLTFFENRFKNFIENVTAPGTTQYPLFVRSFENLENVRIYGIEARTEWHLAGGWRTFGSLAWTEGKDQSTGRYLNSIAPLQAIFGVGYTAQSWGAQAQISAATARKKVAYPNPPSQRLYADFKAPGYGVVDLTAYWRPSHLRGLTLQAGLFNAFDKTYWNALNVPSAADARTLGRYTEPGRNFSVSLTYQY